jgi:hypothetical protein
MKTKLLYLSLLILGLVLPARAQYPVVVVGDPIAVENHLEDIAKWTQSIAYLDSQLQQMQQYVALAQQMKSYIGDPAAAAGAMELQLLGSNQLSQSVGQLTSAINHTVDGAKALENSGSQLFAPIDSKTPSGFAMNFDPTQFKAFAAIQDQSANVTNVVQDTVSRISALQQQKATTLAQIQTAPDQSTVQKLTAQASAIDGQVAALGQQQQTATDQIVTQNVANQNDKEMKAQAANQAADHEMNVSLQNFMQWEGQVSSDRTKFQ